MAGTCNKADMILPVCYHGAQITDKSLLGHFDLISSIDTAEQGKKETKV